MESLNELNRMVEELVVFDMNSGITPIELASNIYEEGYTEVRMLKRFGLVECSVFFYDTEYFSDKKLKYEYRYKYDVDNVLQEIVQIQSKQLTPLWSRKEERSKLITNILEFAKDANVNLENLLSLDNIQRLQSQTGS
ncbi:hypothetical protein P4H27_00205 [Paenibacillus taichungensis]|uniref:hypothetical protein n=1 Tax=Paenibacillus taichungensis TaxID=484184 RepID=UPI002DBE7714|nr:hypothetical protein [Paenibacillus taichungensis]MEC0105353.1 hypothetical protein [Paenibacillus taichungensis]MEC0200428.1 hypothetical protein [Paenibacillus taichungensis]